MLCSCTHHCSHHCTQVRAKHPTMFLTGSLECVSIVDDLQALLPSERSINNLLHLVFQYMFLPRLDGYFDRVCVLDAARINVDFTFAAAQGVGVNGDSGEDLVQDEDDAKTGKRKKVQWIGVPLFFRTTFPQPYYTFCSLHTRTPHSLSHRDTPTRSFLQIGCAVVVRGLVLQQPGLVPSENHEDVEALLQRICAPRLKFLGQGGMPTGLGTDNARRDYKKLPRCIEACFPLLMARIEDLSSEQTVLCIQDVFHRLKTYKTSVVGNKHVDSKVCKIDFQYLLNRLAINTKNHPKPPAVDFDPRTSLPEDAILGRDQVWETFEMLITGLTIGETQRAFFVKLLSVAGHSAASWIYESQGGGDGDSGDYHGDDDNSPLFPPSPVMARAAAILGLHDWGYYGFDSVDEFKQDITRLHLWYKARVWTNPSASVSNVAIRVARAIAGVNSDDDDDDNADSDSESDDEEAGDYLEPDATDYPSDATPLLDRPVAKDALRKVTVFKYHSIQINCVVG
jgi:hypothetical protein